MTLRERVARIFDPAAFSDEAAVIERTNLETFWPMRRHLAFEKADAIIQLILEDAAKVLTDKADSMRGSLTGDMMARIFEDEATAIRKLGSDARG